MLLLSCSQRASLVLEFARVHRMCGLVRGSIFVGLRREAIHQQVRLVACSLVLLPELQSPFGDLPNELYLGVGGVELARGNHCILGFESETTFAVRNLECRSNASFYYRMG